MRSTFPVANAASSTARMHTQLPIHLEVNVQQTLAEMANAKGVDLSVFVNDLLKKDIELIQMGR
jgi:post-segregation antitoxin (ccd killing protein)